MIIEYLQIHNVMVIVYFCTEYRRGPRSLCSIIELHPHRHSGKYVCLHRPLLAVIPAFQNKSPS